MKMTPSKLQLYHPQQNVKVPMPAHRFKSSDWSIL